MKRRVSLRINFDKRVRLAPLMVSVLLPLFFLILLLWNQGEVTASSPQSINTTSPSMRQYYLTSSGNFDGADASTACAAGYHMASLWEILEPSNLKYNTPLGDSRGDSGYGPPTATFGWIHTGYISDNIGDAGQANCSTWSINTPSTYGSVVALPSQWNDPSKQDISIWETGLRECSEVASVWCVQNTVAAGSCSVPISISCGQQVSGNTTTFPNNHDNYSNCSSIWSETGPETIYSLELPPGGVYTVTAQISGMSVDLDVFILDTGQCDSGECENTDSFGDTTAIATNLSPATYYISVDGFLGAAGSYTLDLTCDISVRAYLPLLLR